MSTYQVNAQVLNCLHEQVFIVNLWPAIEIVPPLWHSKQNWQQWNHFSGDDSDDKIRKAFQTIEFDVLLLVLFLNKGHFV